MNNKNLFTINCNLCKNDITKIRRQTKCKRCNKIVCGRCVYKKLCNKCLPSTTPPQNKCSNCFRNFRWPTIPKNFPLDYIQKILKASVHKCQLCDNMICKKCLSGVDICRYHYFCCGKCDKRIFKNPLTCLVCDTMYCKECLISSIPHWEYCKILNNDNDDPNKPLNILDCNHNKLKKNQCKYIGCNGEVMFHDWCSKHRKFFYSDSYYYRNYHIYPNKFMDVDGKFRYFCEYSDVLISIKTLQLLINKKKLQPRLPIEILQKIRQYLLI